MLEFLLCCCVCWYSPPCPSHRRLYASCQSMARNNNSNPSSRCSSSSNSLAAMENGDHHQDHPTPPQLPPRLPPKIPPPPCEHPPPYTSVPGVIQPLSDRHELFLDPSADSDPLSYRSRQLWPTAGLIQQPAGGAQYGAGTRSTHHHMSSFHQVGHRYSWSTPSKTIYLVFRTAEIRPLCHQEESDHNWGGRGPHALGRLHHLPAVGQSA